MEFHRVLKKKRMETNLSQEDLAKKLKISRQSISNGKMKKVIQTLKHS